MIKIHTILCRAQIMDNYSYLIIDLNTQKSAIVDASEAAPIINKCNELKITPDYIFSTHHHFDHTDANLELKQKYSCEVVGADDRIPGLDIKLKDGDVFLLGATKVQIIDVSAHTQKSILFYFADDKALFTGDTLFNLCVGGLFEGTETQMEKALDKIRELPEDVSFYPGHEYTMYAASDALRSDPNNKVLQDYIKKAEERLAQGLPVHPITLKVEKLCNPYLR